jgi:CTP synthase
MTRFIFITGGVVSSLGKGHRLRRARRAAAGARLQGPPAQARPLSQRRSGHDEPVSARRGLRHRRRRRDRPRSRPLRALHRRSATKGDNITTGASILDVIAEGTPRRLSRRHRPGHPARHRRHQGIRAGRPDDADFVLCEIGGTVGDIEGLPFLEAIRQLGNELGRERTPVRPPHAAALHPVAGELKTKPTQHSVKELRSIGIQPDILLCRCDREDPGRRARKIALFCNVRRDAVIEALDVATIYEVPLAYHAQGFDARSCAFRHRRREAKPDLTRWQRSSSASRSPTAKSRSPSSANTRG